MGSMKYLVLLAFIGILASLGAALFFMMRTGRDAQSDATKGRKMAWALAMRVALSVALFGCLLLAWKLGYIQPTGLPRGT